MRSSTLLRITLFTFCILSFVATTLPAASSGGNANGPTTEVKLQPQHIDGILCAFGQKVGCSADLSADYAAGNITITQLTPTKVAVQVVAPLQKSGANLESGGGYVTIGLDEIL